MNNNTASPAVAAVAARINGLEYQIAYRSIAALRKELKEAGIAVVYGQSDDLMEFDGAIYDELGAGDGTEALVDRKGLLPNRESIDNDEELEEFFARRRTAKKITAFWCPPDHPGMSWLIATEDFPHATFEIVEDGEVYCRGIVFELADVGVEK